MSIWNVGSYNEVELVDWRIYCIGGDLHLVGYEPAKQQGRVSSKLDAIDKTTMTALTRSGRKYNLKGPDGYNTDAMYVWGVWLNRYNIDLKDVENHTEFYNV